MISTEIRRSQTYVGTGDVNSYTFPFRVFAADQVKVYVRAADAASGTLLDTTQYSVTLASASAQTVGGTVTLSSPLAAGTKLVILSNIPYTQLLALQNQGAFNAEDLNGAWDKNTALIQQVLDTLNRAVLAPELGDDTPEAFTLSLFEARDTAVEKAGEAANSASASAASARDAAASATAAAFSAAEAEASKNAINVTKEQVTAEGRKQIATIQTEGGTQISNVQSVGQGEVDRITQTGGTWNDTVVATGQKWKQDVISAGSDSLAKATAQAVAAETSANKASGFADAASASAKAAETSENVAVSSATAAGVSEAKAKASETAAASSKTAAAGSASAASQSAAAADTSATEAGGRAAAAKASEDKAKEYANQASSGQIQADWAETDTAAKSYIKNKPVQLTSEAVSTGTATEQGTISAAALKASIQAVSPAQDLSCYLLKTDFTWAGISGKPTIPAAQVQTDWNATTGMGVLLNKPAQMTDAAAEAGTATAGCIISAATLKAAITTLAPAPDLSGYVTTVDFTWANLGGKPTIPAAQVNSDWSATSGAAQILNKPALGALASKDQVEADDIAAGAIPADATAAAILAAFTQFATENGIT